ncbi:cysteine-rich CWC family protein [Bacillus sp. OxB-1]|uniref:cysteine-rich CWC family protein n=1 Tax=Bacillus sp. (strain OxB-1) TaxID=98228 RepID=UPI00059730C6
MKTIVEVCPICGKGNNCCNGKEKSLGDCWCTQESFPQEIFDEVPADQLRKTCICQDCLDSFKSRAPVK